MYSVQCLFTQFVYIYDEYLQANFKDSNMEHVLHLFDNSNEDDEEEIDISDEKDDFHTDVSEIKR